MRHARLGRRRRAARALRPVPVMFEHRHEKMVRYNNQGDDPSEILPMPGRISDGSREPQMVAVPPPEFWHSIRQEVERMGMHGPVPAS